MKKKQCLSFLLVLMLLAAMLGGCKTVENTALPSTDTTQETTEPTQPEQKSVQVYPIDVHYIEYAVLDLEPQELEITWPNNTEDNTEDGEASADGVIMASEGENVKPTGVQYSPSVNMVFRTEGTTQDKGEQSWKILVWLKDKAKPELTGTLSGDTVTWDKATDTENDFGISQTFDVESQVKDKLGGVKEWASCKEDGVYAYNLDMKYCKVDEQYVFYTDENQTTIQCQRYADDGSLLNIAEVLYSAEDLDEWDNEELCPEITLSTPTDAADPDDLPEPDGTQDNFKTGIIILSVAVVLLIASNLLCLTGVFGGKGRGFIGTRRKKAQGVAAGAKGAGAVHNIGSRSSQQDSFGVIQCAAGTLAVVADGMGGLSDGDKVSQKIVATMRADAARIQPGQTDHVLCQMVSHVNQEVNRMLGAARQYKCGSTLLAVLIERNAMQWIAVGDSRIYLYRNGSLVQINREHVYCRDLLKQAVNRKMSVREALTDSQADRLSSFIGMGELKHVDVCLNRLALCAGDRILLMSDGVFNTLSNEEIAGVMQGTPDAAGAAAQLEQRVLQRRAPNQDNFTCVVLEV